jgi:hypothetical protein
MKARAAPLAVSEYPTTCPELLMLVASLVTPQRPEILHARAIGRGDKSVINTFL